MERGDYPVRRYCGPGTCCGPHAYCGCIKAGICCGPDAYCFCCIPGTLSSDCTAARTGIAVMVFLAGWCSYMIRVVLSIALLQMAIPPAAYEENVDRTNYYDISEEQQGYMLAAYFYGYLLTLIPGRTMAEAYGPRWLIFSTTLVAAIFTIALPFVVGVHLMMVFLFRFITGLSSGSLYPALHLLITRWAPASEQSQFIWCLLGGTFGTIFTWPIVGAAMYLTGLWSIAFFIAGGVLVVFLLFWLLFAYNYPGDHPRIGRIELLFLHDSVSQTDKVQLSALPLGRALTSLSYISLIILHFANLWGINLFITEAPRYFMYILQYNVLWAGILAATPFLARLLLGIAFSSLGDWILYDTDVDPTLVRKLFVIPSHILPGILALAIGLFQMDSVVVVIMMVAMMGLNGAATCTCLANHHDLAPSFAGTLYGIQNSIGTSTGFIVPVFVGLLLMYGDYKERWRWVFYITAGMYLVSGGLFIVFGSGKRQSWDKEYTHDYSDTSLD